MLPICTWTNRALVRSSGYCCLQAHGLAQRRQRRRDLADVVQARAEVREHHQLAGPVAFDAGQRDHVAERGLGLDVAIAGVEQDAEIGVVLDLAPAVAEAEQARLGRAHRVGAVAGPCPG